MSTLLKKLPSLKGISPKTFLKSKKPTLIMEVGRKFLKLAVVTQSLDKFHIQKLIKKDLKEDEKIKDVIEQEKIQFDRLIIILTRDQVTARNLELPTVDPNEISDIVDIQSAKQTPFSKEEIISDYQTIGLKGEHYTKVFLAIAQTLIIDKLLSNFAERRNVVEKIALSSECFIGWAPIIGKHLQSETVALINVEYNVCDLCIISSQKLLFSRVLQFDALRLDVDNWQKEFLEELSCSLKAYERDGVGPEIKQIVLTGDETTANTIMDGITGSKSQLGEYGLEKYELKRFRLENEIEGVNYSQDVEIALQSSKTKDNTYAALIGLCSVYKKLTFNFLPGDIKKAKVAESKRKEFALTGTLTILVLLAITGVFLAKGVTKTLLLGSLTKELSKLEEKTADLTREKQKLDLIKGRMTSKNSAIEVLRDVYRVVPQVIYLVAVNFEEGKSVSLRGSAAEVADVMKFVAALEESEIFANIKTDYFSKRKVKDKEFVDFELICPFEK